LETAPAGTTAVAAINTGRQFIGIEMDGRFAQIAMERTEDARINS